MRELVKAWIEDQRFTPSLGGVLVNRDFIIRRSLWNAVRRHAPAFTGRVLDFGCGEKPYRRAFPASEYVGLDIEISGHDPAKKKADVYYDGTILPFGDATFEGVVSFEVFQSVPNPGRMMAEIARVLKPGGLFLLSYPFAWEEFEMPYDLARYTSAGLAGHMEAAGFQQIALEKTPGYLPTLTQMFTLWLSHTLLPWRNRLLRQISTALFVAPLNSLGLLIGCLVPNDGRYYHNCVILARKSSD